MRNCCYLVVLWGLSDSGRLWVWTIVPFYFTLPLMAVWLVLVHFADGRLTSNLYSLWILNGTDRNDLYQINLEWRKFLFNPIVTHFCGCIWMDGCLPQRDDQTLQVMKIRRTYAKVVQHWPVRDLANVNTGEEDSHLIWKKKNHLLENCVAKISRIDKIYCNFSRPKWLYFVNKNLT